MNKNEIDQLLSKFYRGETTLDEEQQLRDTLSDDSIDALLMKELEGIDNEIEVPADLESNLSNLIDQWDAEEQQEAKVAPSMWRRTSWWAAAASVAIVATVGIWFLRNKQQVQVDTQQPVIAQIEEPTTPSVIEDVPPAETQPELEPAVRPRPQHDVKPKAQPRPASAFKNRTEQLAQAQVKTQGKTQTQAQSELSASDEEIALAALEKFSTTLNKGMDQLDDAGEKIDNINNTIKQYLL